MAPTLSGQQQTGVRSFFLRALHLSVAKPRIGQPCLDIAKCHGGGVLTTLPLVLKDHWAYSVSVPDWPMQSVLCELPRAELRSVSHVLLTKTHQKALDLKTMEPRCSGTPTRNSNQHSWSPMQQPAENLPRLKPRNLVSQKGKKRALAPQPQQTYCKLTQGWQRGCTGIPCLLESARLIPGLPVILQATLGGRVL